MADDITNDDLELLGELGVEAEPVSSDRHSVKEQRIIAGFEEIQRFVEEHGRLPQHDEKNDVFERLYAVRLDSIRASEECRAILRGLDTRGLLGADNEASASQLKDEPSDEALLASLGVKAGSADDVTQLVHVRSRDEVKAAEEVAQRNPCRDFDDFQPIFEKAQHELDSGERQTLPYKDNAEVRKGDLFILDGQKLVVAEMGDSFVSDYGRPDRRLRVVYSNGTESDLLLRSLQRALNKDKTSRRITAPDFGPLFSEEMEKDDLPTGYTTGPGARTAQRAVPTEALATGKDLAVGQKGQQQKLVTRKSPEPAGRNACPTSKERRQLISILEGFGLSVASFDGLRSDSYEKQIAGWPLRDLERFYEILLGAGRSYKEMALECPTWGEQKKAPHFTTLKGIKHRIMAEQSLNEKMQARALVAAREAGRVVSAEEVELPEGVDYLEEGIEILGEELLSAKLDGRPVSENLRLLDRLLKMGSLRVKEERLAWEKEGKPINQRDAGPQPVTGTDKKTETAETEAEVEAAPLKAGLEQVILNESEMEILESIRTVAMLEGLCGERKGEFRKQEVRKIVDGMNQRDAGPNQPVTATDKKVDQHDAGPLSKAEGGKAEAEDDEESGMTEDEKSAALLKRAFGITMTSYQRKLKAQQESKSKPESGQRDAGSNQPVTGTDKKAEPMIGTDQHDAGPLSKAEGGKRKAETNSHRDTEGTEKKAEDLAVGQKRQQQELATGKSPEPAGRNACPTSTAKGATQMTNQTNEKFDIGNLKKETKGTETTKIGKTEDQNAKGAQEQPKVVPSAVPIPEKTGAQISAEAEERRQREWQERCARQNAQLRAQGNEWDRYFNPYA